MHKLRLPGSRIAQKAILGCAIVAAVWGFSFILPPAVDWPVFRAATLKLLAGRSPYEVEGFFNPFWALIPLIPIAILPEPLSRAALFVATLLALTYTAHRLGGKLAGTLLLLMSPPAIHGLLNGNIDWLAALGIVLPSQIGLFFVTIKPQIGLAIAIFWTTEAWKKGGWQRVVKLLWPLIVAFVFSTIAFGFWPARATVETSLWWNASLWPMSIPVGLALLVTAIRKGKINYAIGASPCLSPYVLFHSWIVALLAIVHSLPELSAAVSGLWILVIMLAIR